MQDDEELDICCEEVQKDCCDQRSEDQKKIDADSTTNQMKEDFKNIIVRGNTQIGFIFDAARADPYRISIRIYNSSDSSDPITILNHTGQPPFSTTGIKKLNPGETLEMNQKDDRRCIQEEFCIISDGVSIVETTEQLDTTGKGK